MDVSLNVSLPAKIFLEPLEFPYQPSTVKVNVDFAICAQLLPKMFLNALPIAPLERPLVSTLAKRARLFALDVELSKSLFL